MAAPSPPIQFCLLVSYPHGLALSTGLPPVIAVYARVVPGDDTTLGILMRVERFDGAVFVHRGNGAVKFVGTGNPQAEFLDSGVFGQVYSYRVRLENNDGVSAYSATVNVDTTLNGSSGCDSGNFNDLAKRITDYAGIVTIEYTAAQIKQYAGLLTIEYLASPAEGTIPTPTPPPPDPPPPGPTTPGCQDVI